MIDMNAFMVRLVIAVCVVWLVQTLLTALNVKEPANKVLFLVTLIVAIVFVLFGGYVLLV